MKTANYQFTVFSIFRNRTMQLASLILGWKEI